VADRLLEEGSSPAHVTTRRQTGTDQVLNASEGSDMHGYRVVCQSWTGFSGVVRVRFASGAPPVRAAGRAATKEFLTPQHLRISDSTMRI
jgi:hypothetical protein